MPLNPDRVGHTYPAYRYEVSREKVREYALATDADDPRYLADEGEVVAPPTFAACFTIARGGHSAADPKLSTHRAADPKLITHWAADPELGAHPALVHASQEYEFHRPIRVGDVLECSPSIADVTLRGRTDLLTVETACVDAVTKEPVVTARSMLVFFNADSER